MRVIGLEEMRSHCVAQLMPRHGDLVALGVLHRDCESRLDVAHSLPDVCPRELVAPIVKGVEQRER